MLEQLDWVHEGVLWVLVTFRGTPNWAVASNLIDEAMLSESRLVFYSALFTWITSAAPTLRVLIAVMELPYTIVFLKELQGVSTLVVGNQVIGRVKGVPRYCSVTKQSHGSLYQWKRSRGKAIWQSFERGKWCGWPYMNYRRIILKYQCAFYF